MSKKTPIETPYTHTYLENGVLKRSHSDCILPDFYFDENGFPKTVGDEGIFLLCSRKQLLIEDGFVTWYEKEVGKGEPMKMVCPGITAAVAARATEFCLSRKKGEDHWLIAFR